MAGIAKEGGSEKIAVVLFNLGGPDCPAAVRPFLFNLFFDPAIIGLPGFLRAPLAAFIAWRRAPAARAIYAEIGGASPILKLTEDQATALEKTLAENSPPGRRTKVFIAMRYWHPMSDETARAVKDFDPDEVLLLPLYPQFSTTTTASSISDWRRAAKAAGLSAPVSEICCYPVQRGFIRAQAALIRNGLAGAEKETGRSSRLLFSAHGLPKKIIDRGDPYVRQVEKTAAAIVDALGVPGLDWAICYQSRVGSLEWVGPNIDDELKRAAGDKVAVVVTPVAFVSEHSETLVELDIKYRGLAAQWGVPGYVRVPTVGVTADFIGGLAELVDEALRRNPDKGNCPPDFAGCFRKAR
ncbi:MAG TPA: ferrochelatase [Alphaproteobacteria bacterium]|nr:ferrochelatase [Alphaproteobacteria bacterium]